VKGFTLIEAMIALSIAIIVCVIAIPSFHQQVKRSTNKITQSQLLDYLQQAQQVANAKMINIAVCLSRDGKTCVASDSNKVLVFADSHADGILHDDTQLMSSVTLKGDGLLHLRAYPFYRHYILMQPAVVNKSDNGTFWYCDNNHTLQWAITVSQSGEPHTVEKPAEQLGC
jgi:Tfp pilus assembly protein FimT